MLLQGNLREFSLPKILLLVDANAGSGVLTVSRKEALGRIYFRDGLICYAFSIPQHLPLGERLVKDGAITVEQLRQALVEQERGTNHLRIGAILLNDGALDRGTLERAVRDQIQDAVFDFFGWPDGVFDLQVDEQVTDEDILVDMNVEEVIQAGCRRTDEWELFVEHIGSMERIPRLTCPAAGEGDGEIVLTPQEWCAVARVDGRADINTVLRDAHLDHFHGVKAMCSLYARGLIAVKEPAVNGAGRTASVAVRGPIDIYNEVFLMTLTNGALAKRSYVELIDGEAVETPVLAGRTTLGDDEEREVLVLSAPAATPDEAWRRVAAENAAWIALVNANDADSVRAAHRDIDFRRTSGGSPLVVATYVSTADDELDAATGRRFSVSTRELRSCAVSSVSGHRLSGCWREYFSSR